MTAMMKLFTLMLYLIMIIRLCVWVLLSCCLLLGQDGHPGPEFLTKFIALITDLDHPRGLGSENVLRIVTDVSGCEYDVETAVELEC